MYYHLDENIIKNEGPQQSEKSNGKIKSDYYYSNIAGTFNIDFLKNSLSIKCDELVKFQSDILEKINDLLVRISKKNMEE